MNFLSRKTAGSGLVFLFSAIGGILLLVSPSDAQAAYLSETETYGGRTVTIFASEYFTTDDCLSQGVGSVTFLGRQAQVSGWYNCIGQVNFVVPAGSGTGDVVLSKGGSSYNVGRMTVKDVPSITSISPSAVVPGESYITISGRGFGNIWYDDSLYFGGIEVQRVSEWSDTRIVAQVPFFAPAGRVQLVTPGPRVTESSNYHLQPAVTEYDTYVGPPQTQVTIKGRNFKDNFANTGSEIRVFFNGVQADLVTDSWTTNQIVAFVPNGATEGAIEVRITSSDNLTTVSGQGPTFRPLYPSAYDPLSSYQQYLQQSRIPDAWNVTKGSRDVIVAVIDDGVYLNHPDLSANFWENEKEIIGNRVDDDRNGYVDDRYGWDFLSNGGEMSTRGTHGTMVAGIIGAVGNNGIGITGINWNVRLMSVIVCGDACPGLETNLPKAIRYAVNNGAKVINISLGTVATAGFSETYNEAIRYAYDKGAVIVAAAGNGDPEGGLGFDLSRVPQSPVCNDNNSNMVLGVGAVDSAGYRPTWSNYGGCVDVYAPGTDIASTAVPAFSSLQGFYDIESGTSFSAPIVSGVAALLRAKYPTMTNKEIIQLIVSSSEGGVINALRALSTSYNAPAQNQESVANQNIIVDKVLTERMKGKLLLQVEEGGRIWYVSPATSKRYEVTFANALPLFRSLAEGINDANLARIATATETRAGDRTLAGRFKGRLLLQVEQGGRIWYVEPVTLKRHEVTFANLLDLFRSLALGISNGNLAKIPVGIVQ